MTVIEAVSPGDAWVKVSKHLLERGEKVGELIEELNVMMEITEFQSDDWFDSHFREIMGDDRIDFASSVTFVEPQPKKPINDLTISSLKTIGISPIGEEWLVGRVHSIKLKMLLRF